MPAPRVYHRDHPFIEVSDIQNVIDESRSIGRKMDKAFELHQQHLDISRRELEVQRETRTAVEKLLSNSDRIVADSAETLVVLRQLLVATNGSRDDMRELMNFFTAKKTNGNGDHAVEPDHEHAHEDDRERR